MPDTTLICINADEKHYPSKPPKPERGAIRDRIAAKPVEITGQELEQYIANGQTYTAARITGTDEASFVSLNLLACDIDNVDDQRKPLPPEHQVTLGDIRRTAKAKGIELFMVYESFSSTAEHPRFRVLACLDKPVTDSALAKRLNGWFQHLFSNSDDTASLEHYYFGTTPEKISIHCTGKLTSLERVTAQMESDAQASVKDSIDSEKPQESRSGATDDHQLTVALSKYREALQHIDLEAIDYTHEYIPLMSAMKTAGFSMGYTDEFFSHGNRYTKNEVTSRWEKLNTKEGSDGRVTVIPAEFIFKLAYGADWQSVVRNTQLPGFINITSITGKNQLELAPELISNVLRVGHIALFSAASKTGKSCAMLELAAAIASGSSWLGHKIMKGRVLYINLEIDEASVAKRFQDFFDCIGISEENQKNIDLWQLRGKHFDIKQATEYLLEHCTYKKYLAIIIDPIYLMFDGDENSAGDVKDLFTYLFQIVTDLGTTVIYVHHHSKGSQSWKNSMDRGSGSGVHARAVDALIDMLGLEATDEVKEAAGANAPKDRKLDFSNAAAYQVDYTLRDFAPIPTQYGFFVYPQHVPDYSGMLCNARSADEAKSKDMARRNNRVAPTDHTKRLDDAYDAVLERDGQVTVPAIAEQLGLTTSGFSNLKTNYGGGRYKTRKGIVTRSETQGEK